MHFSSATYLDLRCSGNRNNVITLRKQPRESDLAGSAVIPLPNGLQTLGKFDDIWEVLGGVSNNRLALY